MADTNTTNKGERLDLEKLLRKLSRREAKLVRKLVANMKKAGFDGLDEESLNKYEEYLSIKRGY